jgi:hypothetical protein
MSNQKNTPALLSTRLNALKQRAATTTAQTNRWKPTAGETIAGVVVGGETFNHPLYGSQNAILLETDSGVVSVVANNYIQTALKNQNAERGDLCAITFLGQGVNKHGNKFNRYNVIVEKMGGLL